MRAPTRAAEDRKDRRAALEASFAADEAAPAPRERLPASRERQRRQLHDEYARVLAVVRPAQSEAPHPPASRLKTAAVTMAAPGKENRRGDPALTDAAMATKMLPPPPPPPALFDAAPVDAPLVAAERPPDAPTDVGELVAALETPLDADAALQRSLETLDAQWHADGAALAALLERCGALRPSDGDGDDGDDALRPVAGGAQLSLGDAKLRIQQLSRRLIRLQRREAAHVEAHRALRAELGAAAGRSAGEAHAQWARGAAPLRLLMQTARDLQQRATVVVGAADADAALFHALTRRREALAETLQREEARAELSAALLAKEAAALRSLRDDAARVQRTLAAVAPQSQAIARRADALARHEQRVRRVSLARHFFARWVAWQRWQRRLAAATARWAARRERCALRVSWRLWRQRYATARRGAAVAARCRRALLLRTLVHMRVRAFRSRLARARLAKWRVVSLRRRFGQWRRAMDARSAWRMQQACLAVFVTLRCFRGWRRLAADARHSQLQRAEQLRLRRTRRALALWLVAQLRLRRRCDALSAAWQARHAARLRQRSFRHWLATLRHRRALQRLALLRRHFGRLRCGVAALRARSALSTPVARLAVALQPATTSLRHLRLLLRRWRRWAMRCDVDAQLLRLAQWRADSAARRGALRRWLRATRLSAARRRRRRLCRLWRAFRRWREQLRRPVAELASPAAAAVVAVERRPLDVAGPPLPLPLRSQSPSPSSLAAAAAAGAVPPATLPAPTADAFRCWRTAATVALRLRRATRLLHERRATRRLARGWRAWCVVAARALRRRLQRHLTTHGELLLGDEVATQARDAAAAREMTRLREAQRALTERLEALRVALSMADDAARDCALPVADLRASLAQWTQLTQAATERLQDARAGVAFLERRIARGDEADDGGVSAAALVQAATQLALLEAQAQATGDEAPVVDERSAELLLRQQQSLRVRRDALRQREAALRQRRAALARSRGELLEERERLSSLVQATEAALGAATAQVAAQMADDEQRLDALAAQAALQRQLLATCRAEEQRLRQLLQRLTTDGAGFVGVSDRPPQSLGLADAADGDTDDGDEEVARAQLRGMAMALAAGQKLAAASPLSLLSIDGGELDGGSAEPSQPLSERTAPTAAVRGDESLDESIAALSQRLRQRLETSFV